MTVEIPRLPPGAREIYNSLYRTTNPECLTDDLYLAEMPGEIFIDVGWFPECDPTGAYEICVYQKTFENPLFGPWESRDLTEVLDQIETLAKWYTEKFNLSSETLEEAMLLEKELTKQRHQDEDDEVVKLINLKNEQEP